MKIKNIKRVFIRLLRYNATPHGIALGVAIGVFIAILPVYGLHTILMILAAILIPSTNKIAIFIGTNISFVLTFPFITWGGYEIGRLVLSKDYPALSWSYFSHMDFRMFKEFYYPLFIGSFILALILAAIFYFIAFLVVSQWLKGRKK